MNSVKIMINDQETLAELVRDPEVEVRIKDSVVDSIAKRAVKNGLFKDVKKAVDEVIIDFTHPKRPNDLFDSSNRYFDCRLSDKAVENVKCQIKAHADRIINEAIQDSLKSIVDELKTEVERYQSIVDEHKKTVERTDEFLRNHDYDGRIREIINGKINSGLGKVIVSSFFAADEGKAKDNAKGGADES